MVPWAHVRSAHRLCPLCISAPHVLTATHVASYQNAASASLRCAQVHRHAAAVLCLQLTPLSPSPLPAVAASQALDLPLDLTKSMDNDEVLLESSDDEPAMEQDAAEALESTPEAGSPPPDTSSAAADSPMEASSTDEAEAEAEDAAAAGNGTSGAGAAQGKQQREGGGKQEEASKSEFDDSQYWKTTLQYEVPEDA